MEIEETDRTIARTILDNANLQSRIDQIKIHRLGTRKPGKIRPLKIRFPSEAGVRRILQKVKDLKRVETMSSISLSFDKTARQMEEYKHLRHELLRRKQEEVDGLIIKYIRVIPKNN